MDRPEPRPRQYYVIEKSVVMRYDDRYEEDQRRSVIVTGEPHRPPHSYYRNTEMSTATRGAYLTPTRAYLAGERDVKATAHGQWDDASRERSPPSRYEHPSRNAFMSMAPETSTRAYLAEERDVKAGSRGQRDDISRERSPPSRYEYQPSRKALMSMAPETTTRAYLAEEGDVKASAHGQWDGRPHSDVSRERSPPSRYEQPSRRALMSMAPETSTRPYLAEEGDVKGGADGKWDERPHSSLSRERSPPSRSQNEMRTTQRPLLALMWKDSSEPEKVLHSEPQLPTSSGRVLRRRVYQHHDSDDPDDPEPVSNKKAHKGKDDTETLEELATLLSNPKKAATKKNSKRQTRANKKKSIESESEEEEQGAGTSKKVETGPKFSDEIIVVTSDDEDYNNMISPKEDVSLSPCHKGVDPDTGYDCCICQENWKTGDFKGVLLPCKHEAFCYHCALGHKLNNLFCPLCREFIEDIESVRI